MSICCPQVSVDKLEKCFTSYDRFELSLVPPGHYEFGPVSSEWSYRHTHTHTYTHKHTRIAVTHCGSRLVQLLLGSDINTEQIGGDLQPLLFDLSSSCHISWHCPPATPRGAGRTGMASTCLPGLFSVFFPFQLIPLCPLHGFSSANYKSSPTPSDSPDSRDLQSTSLSSSERSDATSACDVSLRLLFYKIIVLCAELGHCPHSLFQVLLKDSPLKISF